MSQSFGEVTSDSGDEPVSLRRCWSSRPLHQLAGLFRVRNRKRQLYDEELWKFCTLQLHSIHHKYISNITCGRDVLCNKCVPGAYPRFKKWGDESWRAQGMRCLRRRGVGVGRGCPRPTGRGVWEGAMPLPRFCFRFWAQNGKFWCILRADFIAVKLSVLHA